LDGHFDMNLPLVRIKADQSKDSLMILKSTYV
jgi:hypothetical protein